jgi:hypothetical protein
MNPALRSEVTRLGGDPTDQIWGWFLRRGPHGNRFSWSITNSDKSPGYVGLEHLKKVVAELADGDSEFNNNALSIARLALQSIYPDIIRRGIQIVAVLGNKSDLENIEALIKQENELIKEDAKACSFELKQKIRHKTE